MSYDVYVVIVENGGDGLFDQIAELCVDIPEIVVQDVEYDEARRAADERLV